MKLTWIIGLGAAALVALCFAAAFIEGVNLAQQTAGAAPR